MEPLRAGKKVTSPVTGDTYVINKEIACGGFGCAYEVQRGAEVLCLKLTEDSESWHREAYMAELLQDDARVVRVIEAFPVMKRGGVLYGIAMELAEGTVADFAEDSPWPEQKVVSEIRGLLGAVGRLHASGAVHRDITPMNVFCCGRNKTLKLGDFGIARHGLSKKGVPADAFAPWFVDTSIYSGSRRNWSPSEDLWQVGQVAAVLLSGEVSPITTKEVRALDCSDSVKFTIRRAIGAAQHRFDDAGVMADWLSRSEPFKFSQVHSLKDKTVVFTGPLGLDLPRSMAVKLAEANGAHPVDSVSAYVDYVVVGGLASNWLAGKAGGVKLIEALALREQGFPIKLISGSLFRKLVGAT